MKKKLYKSGGKSKKYQIGGNTFNKKNPLEGIPTPEQFMQAQGLTPK